MVSQYPDLPNADDRHRMAADDHVMRMRLPAAQGLPPVTMSGNVVPVVAPPPWRFEIGAADGTPLLVMYERDGLLVVEGDESRWDEGAARFLHHVLQWSGQAGIAWKDKARRGG